MNEFLYLSLILILRVVQRVCGKTNSLEMPRDSRGVSVYMSVRLGMSAIAALSILVFSGKLMSSFKTLSPLGWLISFGVGASLTVSTVCSLLALNGSSIVLGALFGMSGLLIPTISGIFIFNQKVSPLQWLGIVFLFTASVLLALSSEKTNGKLTVKTILLLFGSMLSNGMTMLLQTLYRAYVPEGSVSLFSFLQFFIPSAAMLIVFGFISAGKREHIPIRFSKKLVFSTAFSALAVFGISQLSTMASEIIPLAVLFPISDGGGMVISALVATVVYKERMTVKSAAGVAIGIAAICIMKLG